jgi:hypothetical protein
MKKIFWLMLGACALIAMLIAPSASAAPMLVQPNPALEFNGTNQYVTFGSASALGTNAFTLEVWFRWTGGGATTSTGTSGLTTVIPLLTKGRGQADNSNVDMNYFLGIQNNRLAADFEEGAGMPTPGLNHPVTGATTITTNTWHHAAVTYNTKTWNLYLDGNLDATLTLTTTGTLNPRADSIQHAALASALNSTGVTEGFFAGRLDEARVWNYARTQAEIQTAMYQQITSASGLLGRWGMNEGAGATIGDSSGNNVTGTATNAPTWVSGALPWNNPPNAPSLVMPANNATGYSINPTLSVNVSDLDADNLAVSFYGRAVGSPGANFTIVALPDTQYYSANLNGATTAMFVAQTQWVVNNRAALNIPYVAHLGDIVEYGDTNQSHWINADSAMSVLFNAGVPHGAVLGNHDQSPAGDPNGTTTFYNQYFGVTRYTGQSYYGGHYGSNNDNHFDLFSVSGMDFIVISFEYDTTQDQPILDWANGLLQTYSTRRAIALVHNLIGTGNPGAFSAQGQAVYNALRGNANLFLMLGGHVAGEGRRSDTYNGNTVHSLLADYQSRTNGGNGWLRLLEFSPANNQIQVRTYSPVTGQYETDADSQFTLSTPLQGNSFQLIGANANVASGSNTSVAWPSRANLTQYEWYVVVSDGVDTRTSATWTFTTGTPTAVTLTSLRASAPAFEWSSAIAVIALGLVLGIGARAFKK